MPSLCCLTPSPVHTLYRPGTITISVARENVLRDSLLSLQRLGVADLQNKLLIQFQGEEGVDSGGLTKDWTLLFSRYHTSCVPRPTIAAHM